MDSNYVDKLIDEDELPELTEADFATLKPLFEVPEDLQRVVRQIRSGDVAFRITEDQVLVPVARSVVERFQATGTNWETKVDEALRQWLDVHQAS